MNTPYPGFPPNYQKVPQTGGLTRRCFVIELRSLGELDNIQLAQTIELLEAFVGKMKQKIITIEKTDVATHDRFDTQLLQALRL